MHDSISQSTAITTTTPDHLEQNGTQWNTPNQSPPPILTSSPTGVVASATTLSPLTPRQLTAITLLCTGQSLDYVASKLHIGRTTLYRWRTANPSFQSELARHQRELHETATRRLRLHLLRSLQIVGYELNSSRYSETRLKTALSLLRHCDLSALLTSPSSLTPDHCLDDLIRTDRASRNLDPALPITDEDRETYLASLPPDEDAPPPETHLRLRGTPTTSPEPYPHPS